MKLVKYKIFEPYPALVHAFSTRSGGVSAPPFATLNLGLHTPDRREDVLQNRRLYFEALGISSDRVAFPEQVHSANVNVVSAPGVVEKCDALITGRKNLFLSVQTADCFPVFIYDPQKEVVALVHSGWRGTAANICAETIRIMAERFDCNSGDLRVAVGAGVQQSCYQVDENTAANFDSSFLLPDGKDHYKLDVQGAVIQQLKQSGIPAGQIEADKTCTHCAEQLYYSYRRDGRQSGRMMGIIGMRD